MSWIEGASAVKEGETGEEASEMAEPEGEGVRERWREFGNAEEVGERSVGSAGRCSGSGGRG